MDSLTQVVLGASVGEAVLGRKTGSRAALWGGICGTLPDLDVFIPMGSAVADFTYHRSFSHSLFVLAALTPLIVWLILKIHPQTHQLKWRWAVLVYAVFATHVLLDSLTVYGTQIFWPLTEYPVSIGSIFIIDPAYTLSLLIGLLVALILRHGPVGQRANLVGLSLSSAYLIWGAWATVASGTCRGSCVGGTRHRIPEIAGPTNAVQFDTVADCRGERSLLSRGLLFVVGR
ncbi:MAG: metal-dependent hydrolase [Candidatus Competibacteraceae bacterium]|nr:metal-dependent hydrolase [Candidatus Competibacteraceae bacterium]